MRVNAVRISMRRLHEYKFPHKSVNLSFDITCMKNELTDFCGNRLWQNDFRNTLCAKRSHATYLRRVYEVRMSWYFIEDDLTSGYCIYRSKCMI